MCKHVIKLLVNADVFLAIGLLRTYQEGIMMRVIFLIVILALAACTITPKPAQPALNTDSIAGFWSGKVTGRLETGQELPSRDIGILIIAGCSSGKVCGKMAEDDQCPGPIILRNVDGNRYYFLSETVSGTRYLCAKGDFRTLELELRSDGTIYFVHKNGATLTGILQRK